MTGANYYVTRCSFGLCVRLLLREPCGILAEPKRNGIPPDILYYARLDYSRRTKVWSLGLERKKQNPIPLESYQVCFLMASGGLDF